MKSAAGVAVEAASATRLCTRYPVAAANICGATERNMQTVSFFMMIKAYRKGPAYLFALAQRHLLHNGIY
jgi:hypothetical protein